MSLTALAGIVRADVLERTRRYAFLLTMLAAVWLGYLVIDGSISLTLDEYRGAMNSAWIGTLVALSSAMFISLVGFYIVRNSITRDRTTRVGQILAGTRVRTVTYLLAKTASNFVVLAAIVAVQVAAAVLMQILSPGGGPFEPDELVIPFLLLTLPPIAVVAAVATLFESVRWLSGGLGNVVFFFLFMGLISVPIANESREFDLLGIVETQASMHAAARAAYPEFRGGFQLSAAPKSLRDGKPPPKLFKWAGFEWSAAGVARRLWWFAAAFFLVLLAVPFFDRFDEAPPAPRIRKRRIPVSSGDEVPAMSVMEEHPDGLGERVGRIVSALAAAGGRTRFGRLLGAEIRLSLKGVHPAWYLVAAGLALACLLSPADAVKRYLLPVAWIWPVLIWSKIGMREAWHGTGQLIFSAPRIRNAQLAAAWGSGVAVAAVTGAGALVNFAITGEGTAIFGAVVGMLFIPSFALASGVWSGGSKLFEAVYLCWWYVGPMNATPGLDFTGGTSDARTSAGYFAATLLCLAAAVVGRRRQTSA